MIFLKYKSDHTQNSTNVFDSEEKPESLQGSGLAGS